MLRAGLGHGAVLDCTAGNFLLGRLSFQAGVVGVECVAGLASRAVERCDRDALGVGVTARRWVVRCPLIWVVLLSLGRQMFRRTMMGPRVLPFAIGLLLGCLVIGGMRIGFYELASRMPNMPPSMYFGFLPLPFAGLLSIGLWIESTLAKRANRSLLRDLAIGFGYAFPMLITLHWLAFLLGGLVWNPFTLRRIFARQ